MADVVEVVCGVRIVSRWVGGTLFSIWLKQCERGHRVWKGKGKFPDKVFVGGAE